MLEAELIIELLKIGLFFGITIVGTSILLGEGINLIIKLFRG